MATIIDFVYGSIPKFNKILNYSCFPEIKKNYDDKMKIISILNSLNGHYGSLLQRIVDSTEDMTTLEHYRSRILLDINITNILLKIQNKKLFEEINNIPLFRKQLFGELFPNFFEDLETIFIKVEKSNTFKKTSSGIGLKFGNFIVEIFLTPLTKYDVDNEKFKSFIKLYDFLNIVFYEKFLEGVWKQENAVERY